MEDAKVDVLNEQKKPIARRRSLLQNRYSAAVFAIYTLLAFAVLISLSLRSILGAGAAMLAAGALILIVQWKSGLRVANNHDLINKELQAIMGQASSTYEYLVRVESRAKFRYDRLSGSLADQTGKIDSLVDWSRKLDALPGIHTQLEALAGLSKELGQGQLESLEKACAENALLRAELADIGDALAQAPEPVTEEILKNRFGAHSSRLTNWFQGALDAQSSTAESQRESEVEDIRNIILSAMAIQRAELNILANRLLDDAPNV